MILIPVVRDVVPTYKANLAQEHKYIGPFNNYHRHKYYYDLPRVKIIIWIGLKSSEIRYNLLLVRVDKFKTQYQEIMGVPRGAEEGSAPP